MYYEPKWMPPKKKSPLEELADGLVSLGKSIGKFIDEVTTTTSVSSSSSTTTISTSTTSSVISAKTDLSVSEMLATLQTTTTTDEFVDKVVAKVPDAVADELVKSEQVLLVAQKYASTKSYEDIIREFMSMSKEMTLPSILSGVLMWGNRLESWLTGSSIIKDSGALQIRPVMLATLWTTMLMALIIKKMGSISDYQKENVAKFAIALVVSVVSGITSYAHSGGSICGFRSPTKYAPRYVKYIQGIRETKPWLYDKIPQILIFKNKDFESMTTYEQASTQQGLNMAYTFRIADNLLGTLQGEDGFWRYVLKKLVESIRPLPTEDEAGRMYRMYCFKEKLYYI